MKTSAAGRAAIAQREGNRLKAYRDTKGIWTIGVGHTAAAGEPRPKAGLIISAKQSDDILERDLADVERAVNSAVKVPVTQNQFDAMVSLAFNIGAGGFKRSTVVKRLNAGDVAGAGEAFMMWNKPPEIIGRRRTERKQFLSGGAKSATLAGAPSLDGTMVALVQTKLAALGYNPGGADGKMGPLTRGAVLAFRNDHGLPVNDTIDAELLMELDTAKPRTMVADRANATTAEVAAKVPEANVHWWNRLGAAVVGGGTASVGALDYIAPATGYLTPLKDFIADVPPMVWIVGVVAVAAALYFASQYGANKATAAFQSGDRR